MTIMVRVVSNQAQARMAALRAAQTGLSNDIMATNRQAPLGGKHISSLMKFGNQLQWTGRMLQYNFTLPLLAAGVAATKFYMDQEKAMTHVAKVYGDTEAAAKQFRKEQGLGKKAAMDLAESYKTDELEALDRAFTAMSEHYAVAKTEILGVAGSWAAAGQSGVALAKSVDATMQAIIIGDMDAAAATKALISIQAQYNMSTGDLMKTLANLNSIENQTSASMQDLITGFEKAAGVARAAGIPAEELAAHIAALVPAAGSAANAGNALKTVYSRLIAPTKETRQVLDYLGFATESVGWNSATAAERLQLMADKFKTMGTAAQNTVASTIASRWQVNRFDILMNELINTHGNYAKALSASENQGESFRRMQDELNTVLESDPKALSRIWVILQNAMVKIIIPLIPFILYLADSLSELVTNFANMDPHLQKFVLFGLVVLAFIGPLVRYMGAFVTLFGVLGKGLAGIGVVLTKVGGLLKLLFVPFQMLGTVIMGTLGFIGSGVATFITGFTNVLLSGMLGAMNGLFTVFASGTSAVAAVWFNFYKAMVIGTSAKRWIAIIVQDWVIGLARMVASTGIIAAIPRIWASMMGSIVLIQQFGWVALLRGWLVNLSLMLSSMAATSKITMLWSSFMAVLGAISSVGFMAIGAAAINFTTTFSALWYGFWGWIGYIFPTFTAATLSVWTAFQSAMLTLQAVWSAAMVSITAWMGSANIAIQAAFSSAWLTAQALFHGRDAVLRTAWSRLGPAIVAVSSAAMLAVQAVFSNVWLALQAVFHGRDIVLRTIWGKVSSAVIAASHATFLGIQAAYNIASSALQTAWIAVYVATSMAWSRASAAIQVAMYRTWVAITRLGTTIIFAIERAWYALRATVAIAWGGLMISIHAAFFRGLAVVTTVGTRVVSALWAIMSIKIMSSMKVLFSFIAKMMVKMLAVMTGPWGIAILIIVGLLYTFRDQVAQIWQNIVNYFSGGGASVGGIFSSLGETIMGVFNALPQGVQNAMVAVVTIIRDAALAVYDWFSYINPFAKHSPSLVDNVENGITAVNKSFSKLSNIKKYTQAAYAEVKRFSKLTASLGVSQQASDQKKDRKTLKTAGAGQALGSYNKLVGILSKLTPMLSIIEAKMGAQQAVVDAWTQKVDAATRSIEKQQSKLSSLQNVLDKYTDRLNAAQASLDDYASAPLKGMQAMEEQIWQNQMAQSKLRYEMMKFEDVYGTFDQLKAKIDAINGAQELLKGTQKDLRNQGAGSEILGQYDKEMAKLDQQKDKYAEAADALAVMQARLDALQREGERLDLVKAMKFDELQHQIDMAANHMKELSFDEIMGGIQKANAEIKKYSPLVDAASAAVNKQQKVVDRLTAARDRLQARLDKEQGTLDRIRERYDSVNGAIQAIEGSLQDVMSAADAANQALEGKKKKGSDAAGYISPGLQNLMDAGNAGFPDPGGKGIPARTDWGSETDLINQFTDKKAFDTASMFEDMNPFKPLMGKAKEFWTWTKGAFSKGISDLGSMFSAIFSGVDFGAGGGDKFSGMFDGLKKAGEFVTEVIRDIAKVFKWAWELLGPEVKKIGKGIWNGLKRIWEQVGPELEKFGELIKPMGQAIENAWKVIKPILAIIAVQFLAAFKIVGSVIAEVFEPVLEMVGGIFAGIIRVIRGFIQIIVGIFTLDLGMIIDGVGNIFAGLFKTIGSIIKGSVRIVWNLIQGLVKGIVGFFEWLWDVLVGHSIVPDIVNGIFFWFEKLAALGTWVKDHVFVPVINGVKWAWTRFKAGLSVWWERIKNVWNKLKGLGDWIKINVFLPVINGAKWLWDRFKAGLSVWWERIKNVWSNLKQLGVWIKINVFEPVISGVKWLWDRFKAGLAVWWERIKNVWNNLKGLGDWVKINVFLPVINGAKWLWDRFKAGLAVWWERIKNVWNKLKKLGEWIKDNVFEPVINAAKWAWTRFKAGLAVWWERIKNVWNKLKKLGEWIKDNVFEPVINAAKWLWERFKAGLAVWWERIKNVWSNLKQLGVWIKTNVFTPVINKVGEAWITVKTKLGGWWEGIKTAFNKLKGLGAWFKTEVMDKVFNAITGAWTSIKTWLGNNYDMLKKPMESIVNVVIKAVNAIISGLNKVADVLPGIDWNISPITPLAKGGTVPTRRVGSGFKTSGARAIVGEGKANYPEFVIPTDPTYRNRAKSLVAMAAAKIGMPGLASSVQNAQATDSHGVPMYGIGGWIGDAWDGVKSIGSKLKELGKNAVSGVMGKVLDGGESVIRDKAPWQPIQSPPLYAIEKMRGWVSETDKLVSEGLIKYAPKLPTGGDVSVPDPANPAGRMSWKGGTFSNKFVANMQAAEKIAGSSISVMQGGFRPATSYSGTSHQGDAVDFRVDSSLISAIRRVGIAAGDRTGLGAWGPHVHAVPGPGAGYAAGSAVWQFQDYMARGGMGQSNDSPWGLAEGGIVKARRGGLLARIGEGGKDEAVVPLPNDWRNNLSGTNNDSGNKINYFYGDLSFPNITDPNDAQAFLDNLDALSKD